MKQQRRLLLLVRGRSFLTLLRFIHYPFRNHETRLKERLSSSRFSRMRMRRQTAWFPCRSAASGEPEFKKFSDKKGRKEGTTISSSSSATSFTQQRIPSCPARIFLVEQSKQEARCLGRMKVAESEAEPTQGILEAKRSTTRFPNFFPSNTFLPWEYPSPSETKDR